MIGGWQVEKRTKRVLTTEHSISHIVQSTTPRERSKNSSTCCWYMASSRVADVRIIPRSRHNSQFNADFLLHDR
jgi:hypothetical protein